jgi:hypothetical protein
MTERKRLRISHCTISQAALFLGVAQPSAWQRLRPLATRELGLWMVPADEVRKWYRERLKAGRTSSRTSLTGTMHP